VIVAGFIAMTDGDGNIYITHGEYILEDDDLYNNHHRVVSCLELGRLST